VPQIDQQDRQDDDQGSGTLADELDGDELRASGEDEEGKALDLRWAQAGLDAQRPKDQPEGNAPDQDRECIAGSPKELKSQRLIHGRAGGETPPALEAGGW